MKSATAVWPFRIGGPPATMSDRFPVDDQLREIAELRRDARRGMLVSGVIVAGVTVGVVVEAVAVPVDLHAYAGTVISLGLLSVLVLSLSKTVALMIRASLHLDDELDELRRQTFAPVNLTVLSPVRTRLMWSPASVQVALYAAHVRNARMHLALMWATVTMISFCAWSLTLLITAGRL